MVDTLSPILTFNRGRISRLALARSDIQRARISAEVHHNFMTRTLGSMMLKPGMEYIGGIQNNSCAVFIPFVFDINDTALIELTSTAMRVWESDAVVARTGVSSTFTNPDFSSSDLTGWTDTDDSGSTSYWITGDFLGLVGTRYASARRRATVTVASTDQNVEHGLRVTIDRGLVTIKIGSSAAGEDYVEETALRPGQYSFAVTPSSDIYVEVAANTLYTSRVSEVSIESSGDMVIDTPWASTDLDLVRHDTSADVIFTACKGIQQRRIERRGARNWGIRKYEPEDGPFRIPNVGNIRLTPSALNGDITLEADAPLFRSGHAGSVFQITSIGQNVEASFTDEDQWTDSIRVSGVSNTRKFQYVVSALGSTVGTVRIQRSDGVEGNWINVTGLSFTSTIDSTHDDGFDNNITFYRIGIASGDFTGATSSDVATASLSYAAGGIIGTARINSVISATESSASVLIPMGSTTATETWREPDWSGFRGYPTATVIHEGRVWWAGKAKFWGSISDAYESFDPEFEGEAGPFNKSFGSGPVDNIPWMMSLGRLIIGTEGRIEQLKTSSLDEPLTPTNFALRPVSGNGATAVQAVAVGTRGFFIQRGGERAYEIIPPGTAGAADAYDYGAVDRTVLVPELGEPGFRRVAVQYQPDIRIHNIMGDGQVAILVSDPAENVSCWKTVSSTGANGVIEDVVVLPGTAEDRVYYSVKREIDGSTVRYLEKWATEPHARGGSSNRIADSFKLYHSTAGSSTVTGADHLVGQEVVLWGSAQATSATSTGVFLGTATVSSTGTFDITSTLAVTSTTVCYGLGYDAWWKSVKLAYASEDGSALTQRKKVETLGVILADVHADGLQFGRSTASTGVFDSLPRMIRHQRVSTDSVLREMDTPAFIFPGEWDTDSRVVLKASAPKPVTAMGLVMKIDTKAKV
jgi:hypothetical protein